MVTKKSSGNTLRGIAIGLILIPLNSYWLVLSKQPYQYQAVSTNMALFFNVILFIFILAALNLLLRKYLPKISLSQGDLIVVYAMLSIASALSATDMMQTLAPVIEHAFGFATIENDWATLFHKYIPTWIAVSDKRILEAYYKGDSSLYNLRYIEGWFVPALAWISFTIVLVFVMLCINVVIRRQWVEEEKLSYPIIQLPLEMTKVGEGFFSNKLMWLGFAVGGSISLINGLNYLYPVIPDLGFNPYRHNIGAYLTEKPWNAVGWMPVGLVPCIAGLAFFMPLDMSFSCWFFYLFWKTQKVAGSMIGFRGVAGLSGSFYLAQLNQQTFGGAMGIAAIALWLSRRHLVQVFKTIVDKTEIDDSNEPIRYRWAICGILGGMAFITLFCYRAGMSIGVILLFFLLYLAFSIAITRIRVEFGTPIHDFAYGDPPIMMVNALGTRRIGAANLTILSFFFYFNRTYRPHPMPHQLESFKLAQEARLNNRILLFAMLIAMVFSASIFFWVYLHIGYKDGGSSLMRFAADGFRRLEQWLTFPTEGRTGDLASMLTGFVSVIFLMAMRMRFLWWTLHPAGYVISAGYAINPFWFSIFLSWLAKWIILKYGGLKGHRRAIYFFLGLILGEFTLASFWSILGVILGRRMYGFIY